MKITKGFQKIKELYRPFYRPALFVFVLLFLGQLTFLARPYLQGKIIDYLAKGFPLQETLIVVAVLFAVYLAGNFFGYLRDRAQLKYLDYKIGRHLSVETLRMLFRFSIGQHLNEHSGLRQSVISKGESAIVQIGNQILYNIVPLFVQIILASIAILLLAPSIGLVVLLSSILYLYLMVRFNLRFHPELRKNNDKWEAVSKQHTEILRHLALIKAEAQEKAVLERYNSTRDSLEGASRDLWLMQSSVSHRYQMMIDTFQMGALVLAILLVQAGVQTPGSVVAILGWVGGIFGNISNIGWMQRQLLRQIVHAEKYADMVSLPPAILENTKALPIPNIEGEIEFKNVSFKYPMHVDEEEEGKSKNNKGAKIAEIDALTNVSFKIHAGETVAIVGHSGAGKTTIIQLLLRGYDPDEGSVLVDRHDLRNIKLQDYLRQIGYVEQHVRLFDGTLRENILFGSENKEEIGEEKLMEIAEKTRINQFFDRLGSAGFEAVIGENGIRLSGGERQRVGIARALIKNPRILIFDEATSSLDAENEALIHDAMREALKGRTGIIIAHRFSTIRDADKIIVMEKGQIVSVGNHASLIEESSIYRKLIERQVVNF